MTTRVPRRAVHGVLLLDKPVGLSSNDALQRAKRLYRAEKAGHTGTLDPLASGLLPIAFGAATKFTQFALDADKRYRATLRLGLTTTTGDGEGEPLVERAVASTAHDIAAVCARLTGAIEQVPPMHSAIKHEGRPLYAYARAGVEVERAPRKVIVHRIDVVERRGNLLVLDIACSKGTYVRTLAEAFGEALGCGAHLADLRRTGSGEWNVELARTLDALAAMSEPERDAYLLAPDTLLAQLPEVRLEDEDSGRFLTGLRRRTALGDAAAVRVYGRAPRAFLGSAHVAAGELIPDRLLSPDEVRALGAR